MDEKEFRELDAWIAEHGFGVEVKRDADGVPYDAAGVTGDRIIAWIPHYTRISSWFDLVKREIERRGWSWMATGSNRGYHFAIWDHVRESGGTPAGYAPELGRYGGETEELAGCLAFKEALSASACRADRQRQALDKHREIG